MFEHVFQFLPATSKFNEQMWDTSGGNIVVIDLEDSLQNVIKPELNSLIKKEGREKLVSYFYQSQLTNKIPGIRVNRFGSEEFEKDTQMLVSLKNTRPGYIFIPKVESKEELENYVRHFSELNINYNFLVPIIETKQGLLQLKNILKVSCKNKLHYFAWGHHDYNLDVGNWPFVEQDNIEYWNIVREFILEVEGAGYHYLCNPLNQIFNDAFFSSIATYEKSLCSRSAGHVVLNYQQAKLLQSVNLLSPRQDFLSTASLNSDQKKQLAEKTVSCFNHEVKTGFTIDDKTKMFISPQQYLAARNFLSAIKK